jgi:Tripartite tricarboxylate transporter family receptor
LDNRQLALHSLRKVYADKKTDDMKRICWLVQLILEFPRRPLRPWRRLGRPGQSGQLFLLSRKGLDIVACMFVNHLASVRYQLAATTLCLFAPWGDGAFAQDYPNRPVTIIVPAAAGGPADTVARIVTNAMNQDLGRRIIVENVGGAGGTIGTARVVKAAPDGYTLLFYNIGLATAATLYPLRPLSIPDSSPMFR